MQAILDEIKTKRKGTPETFFGFGFNINSNKIFGTRGFVSATPREFTNNLLENKLTQLKKHIL
jgi:hypothetical protein